MKPTLLTTLIAALGLVTSGIALAGHEVTDGKSKVVQEPCAPDPRFVLTLRSDYDFRSDFKPRRHVDGTTSGDAFHADVEADYRIPLPWQWPGKDCGQWYFRLGVDHERFDFGKSGPLPLPDTLQSVSGVIAVEYLVKGEQSIVIEARPGVYFQHDINSGTFNVLVRVGTAVPLSDTVFFAIGGEYSGLSRYPFLPEVGIVWLIDQEKKWILLATLPEPKLLYNPSKEFQAWIGGELVSGSFKTDNRDVRPSKLSGAVVDYNEYRVGAGLTYSGLKPITIDFSAGYAVEREFDYHRAGETYRTKNGAPFIKLVLTAEF